MNFRILRAVLEKDARSLLPLATLATLMFLSDALIVRLDLLPLWSTWGVTVLLAVFAVLIISVFQLDSPASLTEDWLCRPAGPSELVGAKLILVLVTTSLPRAIGTLIADVSLGFSVSESVLDASLSFFDAILLPNNLFLSLLLPLMFAAIITRTFVQAFGVLFAVFICVIVIPTPFVRPPGPLDLGIRDELLTSGMAWLATVPARIASLALTVLALWLVYWRRSLMLARVLFVGAVCVTVFLLVLPMGLLSWKSTFAMQAASGPAPPADAAHIYLRNSRACFSATRRDQSSADPQWEDEALRDTGPDAITFHTAIEARGLPVDWRVKLNYVQADYSANGAPIDSLRPANYITDQRGGGSLAHDWMLPESTLQRLLGVRPQLQLTYSLTLLKPREYSVPADGKRHSLPGLGWCSARLDEAGNGIDVDCFSAIAHPTQISAELNEISASRVYGSVDFAPAFVRWPYGEREKLTIESPRLAEHDTITVTAWESAGSLDQTLTLPGILGGDEESCPLPSKVGSNFQQSSWRDAAPHEPSSVTVDEGVQLEVLDFGGQGSPILLLPGLGATAHSYDELAPLLAQKHRVIAVTRRGTGASSKPDYGYDTPRLGQDVLRVMDAMGLQKVVLAGHSIAGDELTWLGGHHPERFDALIYLDAAYDRSGGRAHPEVARLRELARLLPPEPPIPPKSLLNYNAMTKLLEERSHLRYPEGELIAFLNMNNSQLAGSPSIDARAQQAISAAIQAPDYGAVKIPALAIYAIEDSGEPLPPWYDANDPELIAALTERSRIRSDMQRRNIELFRRNVEKGEVLAMQHASHYIIQSNQREVFEAIERFIAERAL